MIRYVALRAFLSPIEEYLAAAGGPLKDVLVPVAIEDLRRAGHTPRCLHVFTDVDRLRTPQRAAVEALAARLVADGVPIWNPPDRMASRLQLLGRLADAGINDFRAAPWRVVRDDPDHGGLRPPWFLRIDDDHQGARSEPCDDLATLKRAARRLRHHGKSPTSMIVIEWRDAQEEAGRYVKYGVFRVGDRLVPRHRFVAAQWMVKHPKIEVDDVVAREMAWMDGPPAHELALVRRAFDLAAVQYGRIDYALRDGGIRVWEINTNPMAFQLVSFDPSPRLPVQQRAAVALREAWAAADAAVGGPPVALPWLAPGPTERLGALAAHLARIARKALP